MDKKSVGMRILWWAEIIISLRILLFTAPVLISKWLERNYSAINLSDWFILILTFISLLYFLAGVSSVTGHRLWRYFHYLAASLTLVLTIGLVYIIIYMNAVTNAVYFLPAVFSLGIITFLAMNRNPGLAAKNQH